MFNLTAFLAQNGQAILWLVVMVVLIVVEVGTTQMICIWFAFGALVTSLFTMVGVSGTWQFVIFVVTSALALLFTRRFTTGILNFKKTPTNADSVIGLCGSVLEEINNAAESGRIRVNGLDWTARTADNSVIHIGDTVQVEAIQGVKLIVVQKLG